MRSGGGTIYLEDRGLEADYSPYWQASSRPDYGLWRIGKLAHELIHAPTSGGTGRGETLVKPSADEPVPFHETRYGD